MKRFIALIALTTAGVIINGYVIGVLWGWFISPLGVPAISTAHAIGLATTIALITVPVPSKHDEDSMLEGHEYHGRYAGRYIIAPWVALGVGWIVGRLM